VGDLVAVLDHFNFSPVNTVLLVALLYFVRQSVKGIFCRIDALEAGIIKVNRRNRRQDIAIRRIEQHLNLAALTYTDDYEE
jgi:hypothetical protein